MALDRNAARTAILEIAAALIDEGGTAALQARELARRAGVSVGTVYNLFGDLDALHRQINADLLDELGKAGAQAMRDLDGHGVVDVRERLLALARAYLDFVGRHGRRWAAMLAFNRARPAADAPDWYTVRQEMLFDLIGDVLADTRLGEQQHGRMIAARALWSAVHGIVTNGYVGATPDREARDVTWEQIDLLVSAFVRGIEAQ